MNLPVEGAASTVALMCGFAGSSCVQAQMVAEPASYALSPDGATDLTDLTWRGWGQPTAVATGQLKIDNCVPDCASGTFRGLLTATVTVTGLEPAGGESFYTLMYVSAPVYHFSVTYRLAGP